MISLFHRAASSFWCSMGRYGDRATETQAISTLLDGSGTTCWHFTSSKLGAFSRHFMGMLSCAWPDGVDGTCTQPWGAVGS